MTDYTDNEVKKMFEAGNDATSQIMPWLMKARKEAVSLGLELLSIDDPIEEFVMLCRRLDKARPQITMEQRVALYGRPLFQLEMEKIDVEYQRAVRELDDVAKEAERWLIQKKIENGEVPF